MSKGPGAVQQSLAAALQKEPNRSFTVKELSALAFPNEIIERKHGVSVRRALKDLGADRWRAGRSGARGWRYKIRLTG